MRHCWKLRWLAGVYGLLKIQIKCMRETKQRAKTRLYDEQVRDATLVQEAEIAPV